jgi:hypothetical protein
MPIFQNTEFQTSKRDLLKNHVQLWTGCVQKRTPVIDFLGAKKIEAIVETKLMILFIVPKLPS